MKYQLTESNIVLKFFFLQVQFSQKYKDNSILENQPMKFILADLQEKAHVYLNSYRKKSLLKFNPTYNKKSSKLRKLLKATYENLQKIYLTGSLSSLTLKVRNKKKEYLLMLFLLFMVVGELTNSVIRKKEPLGTHRLGIKKQVYNL